MTDEVFARLDRLERFQRRAIATGGIAALVTAAAAFGAATRQGTAQFPPEGQPRPVKASSFELVDLGGRTRAVLRMQDGQPTLQFFDVSGAMALCLTVRGTDGTIEYAEAGQVLSLMRPALRAKPLTTR